MMPELGGVVKYIIAVETVKGNPSGSRVTRLKPSENETKNQSRKRSELKTNVPGLETVNYTFPKRRAGSRLVADFSLC
jgi:hypothetical protein